MSESTIRVATLSDYQTVREMVPGLIRDSIYGKFFKDYDLTVDMFKQYVSDPHKKLCLIIGDNKGFAMFDIIAWPYIDKLVKFSRISFIFIDPEERGEGLMDSVLDAFEYWSKSVGAAYCTLGTKNAKRGYKKAEVVYMKEIK